MGEAERGEAAPRNRIPFWCANRHETRVAFASDADVPEFWDCPRCGLPAGQDEQNPPRHRGTSRTRRTWPTCASGAATPMETPCWKRPSPGCTDAAGPDARVQSPRRGAGMASRVRQLAVR